ncbi:MAG: bifunctional (p)ppGpp synthetase/guanosine-3',5'-bis(diphosphate) 3'-pyrophosphohydrolase [Gallionella sp.]|nr:bifunctional (p)ppGpp synthetase/guanosine-3',5'-bis(diphosphate) 3'-pyrophosphohydrolase [Gallionella sp.]
MVSIHSKTTRQLADTPSWLDTLTPSYTAPELDVIRRASELAEPLYAGQTGLTRTPLMQHALGSASILVAMNMDFETIAATILHAVPDFMDDWAEKLKTGFGHNITALVEGISRMEHIRQFSEMRGTDKQTDDAAQTENLRKMLLAMVSDIRVVLIKLAERTQTLRGLASVSADEQRIIAQETQDLFAPLANRMGVWQIKWELEDLSVRYLNPDLYKKVARLLDERRVDRERYISDVVATLKRALHEAGITAEVTGRPKHIYSIINKMKRKHLDFDQLYDVRAVRILVDDVQSCYTALSLVHELWPPIASEYDDYIARPKSNNYRSLHTAVTGPQGQAFEVQIRTREMHQYSELGVAAHWRYKEGGKSDARLDEKIVWLRQILEWKEDISEKGDLREQFKNDLFLDQVYVLTPQGKIIALPRGATPVDFAYTLHTDLGHRTRGAKVNGAIVPLNYPLQNGQRVEILTTRQGGPSRDWVNPTLGYLQGASARAKVRAWFRKQNIADHISLGRAQLDRELHRLGAVSVNQEKLAQRLHFNKPDDLLAAIGRGEMTPHRIHVALQAEMPNKVIAFTHAILKPATEQSSSTGILIEGLGNLLSRTAQCCNPAPPDQITAYITRDRGITIHRQDCAFVQRLTEKLRDRLLDAQWSE